MANDKPLSPREQEVLQLMWGGSTTRDIAQALHRCFNTATMHRKHILEKLGASQQQPPSTSRLNNG
jgi:DNA-binding NarL/FixJ family response regulator